MKLEPGIRYELGDFIVLLDEETKELKITLDAPKSLMAIRPKSDCNCAIISIPIIQKPKS
jgi:hypothetical protein